MNSKVAIRYAKALFQLAIANNQVETELSNLEAMAPLLSARSPFLHWLASPQIAVDLKKELIVRYFGKGSGEIFCNFLLLLLKKGRMPLAPQIIAAYRQLAMEKLSLLDGALISSSTLSPADKENLQKKLEDTFGKKMRLSEKIDPSLIAGMVITIGSQRLDLSMKGKLMRLKKHLLR